MSVGRCCRRAATGAAAVLAAATTTLAAGPARADQVRHHEWWLQTLHVPTAWQGSRGGGVTVALLDTGTDPAQADLAGSVLTGPDYTHSGRLPGSPEWGVHGTAMASLIAGHGHGPGDASGIIGVAPAAKILSIRVTLEHTDPLLGDPNVARGLPGAIARGIRYAVGHGATVIDLPLDPVTTPGAPGAGGSRAERAALAYALRHNVVLVAPAGDDGAGGGTVNYPAAYHGVIAVGAFSAAFVKAPFSSRQPYVTVTAPGVGITAATTPAGYVSVSSTSASSALVAGIAALIRAQFPELTAAQVTRALTGSTVYRPAGGQADGSGYGTVDAGLALLAAARFAAPGPPPSPTASPDGPASRPPASAGEPASRPAASPPASALLVGGAAIMLTLLVAAVVALLQMRRRQKRAARLAPIRLAAQLQPTRDLPEAAAPPEAAGRAAPATLLGFAAQGGGDPGAVRRWPPPALPSRAIAAAGPAGGATPEAGGGGRAVTAEGDSGAARANPGPGWSLPVRQPGGSRLPRIAGAPPWEPAPKPDSELPWTATPGLAAPARAPSSGALGRREPAAPALSPWDLLAQEAWPGGPAAGRPRPQGSGAGQDDPDRSADPEDPGADGAPAGAGGSPWGRYSHSGGDVAAGGAAPDADAPGARVTGSMLAAGLPEDTGPEVVWRSDVGDSARESEDAVGRKSSWDGGDFWDDEDSWGENPSPGGEPGKSRPSWEMDDSTDVRRLYSWNPSDVTESMPAVKPAPED